MGLKEEFEKYADQAERLLNNITNEDKLILYGLYKQVTVGDVNTSRPSMFNTWDRALWDAWKAVEGKSQNEAMNEYISKVNQLLDEPSLLILARLWAPRVSYYDDDGEPGIECSRCL